jgi:esterase
MKSLLHYKIYTEANSETHRRPLLLLHGLLGSMDNWRAQAKWLAQSRPIITVDLRNHGHSPHLVGMSYKQMALDIIAVLEHEKLACIDLLGHSMGGKVAMWLALHYPDRIARLIVVDIAPKKYPLWHQKILTVMLKAPLSQFQSRQQIDQYLSHSIEDNHERAFLSKNLQRYRKGGYKWRCNINEIVRSYLKIAAFPMSSLIFTKPTLFMRGENSVYVMPSDYSLIFTVFVRSQIDVIPNSGHLPHIEQADSFRRCLEVFLG